MIVYTRTNLVKDCNQQTSLHHALDDGHMEIIKLLLVNNANANVQGNLIFHVYTGTNLVKDQDQWTPLHRSSDKGHLEGVKLLLDKNADVNVNSEIT